MKVQLYLHEFLWFSLFCLVSRLQYTSLILYSFLVPVPSGMKLWLPIKKLGSIFVENLILHWYILPTNSVFLLLGTLLVNERMLETYVIARDRFLVHNGKMFPTMGRL